MRFGGRLHKELKAIFWKLLFGAKGLNRIQTVLFELIPKAIRAMVALLTTFFSFLGALCLWLNSAGRY